MGTPPPLHILFYSARTNQEQVRPEVKNNCFRNSGPMKFYFQWCGRTLSPTMFIYIMAQIPRTFYFSFISLRRGPPLYSFNFTLFSFLFVWRCFDCSLGENFLKMCKFWIYAFSFQLFSAKHSPLKIWNTRRSFHL